MYRIFGLALVLCFFVFAATPKTVKADGGIGVLEAALIGAGIGAVVGLIYALATAGDDDDEESQTENDGEKEKKTEAKQSRTIDMLISSDHRSEKPRAQLSSVPNGIVLRF